MDEPSSSLVDALLAGYGEGYRNLLWDGDGVNFSTANVLAGMDARQAAKGREPYEALTRLLTTAMVPAAAAHRAASGSNLPRAINYHNRLEQKIGNPNVNPWTEPFLSAYLAYRVPGHHGGSWMSTSPGSMRLPPIVRSIDKMSDKAGGWLEPHVFDTANLLNKLNQMSSKAPKYKSIY